jgi:hypothetical protein
VEVRRASASGEWIRRRVNDCWSLLYAAGQRPHAHLIAILTSIDDGDETSYSIPIFGLDWGQTSGWRVPEDEAGSRPGAGDESRRAGGGPSGAPPATFAARADRRPTARQMLPYAGEELSANIVRSLGSGDSAARPLGRVQAKNGPVRNAMPRQLRGP